MTGEKSLEWTGAHAYGGHEVSVTPSYSVPHEGGHRGAADNAQRAFMSSMAYQLLWKELRQMGE